MFSEIRLLLFSLPPTSPNQFCGVTWPLSPSSPIYLLLIVVIFYSPVFAKCCLSCLPICTSSVRTLSVNFLFVTPSCLCQNLSVGLVVAYSSHIFRSPQILDGGKTAMRKPLQYWWLECNVGASAILFDLVVRPPRQWRWRRVSNLLKFLMAVTLQCKRIGNTLTTTACNVFAYSLIQRHLPVGSCVVACRGTYRTFDLNWPPPNWGQIHRDSWCANQLILWLHWLVQGLN
jgi:hypothetical protein